MHTFISALGKEGKKTATTTKKKSNYNYPKSKTGRWGTSERIPDCLTHVGRFDLQLGWSFVVVGKRQRALLDGVQQLGDRSFPTLLFHSLPGRQLILLHQVVCSVH